MDTISVSCINEVMNAQASVKENIVVGLAATRFVGSDRYAYVVTDVINDKKIRVSQMLHADYCSLDENESIQHLDTSRMINYVGISGDGKHFQPLGIIYTLRKNGRWMPEGAGLWETGSIHLGHAEEYMDPSF